MQSHKVAVLKSENYGEEAIEAVINLLELLDFRTKKNSVFLKPNMIEDAEPSSCVITHPDVIRGVIRYFKSKGIDKFFLGDGPRMGINMERAFSATGYEKLAKEEGVQLVDLYKSERKPVNWKFGTLELPSIAFDSCYVNIAKMKTHCQTTVTLGMKNQKGLLKYQDKKLFHNINLNAAIVELSKVVRPELTVLDGIWGIEGNGPGRTGKKKKAGVIVAGTDMYAVDSVGAGLMGVPVEEIAQLSAVKIPSFKLIGDDVASLSSNWLRAKSWHRLLNIYIWWDEYACSGCHGTLLSSLKKAAMSNPKYLFKLILNGVLGRLDIVMGKNPPLPEKHGKVVLVGNCAALKFGEKADVIVRGCPPTAEGLLEAL